VIGCVFEVVLVADDAVVSVRSGLTAGAFIFEAETPVIFSVPVVVPDIGVVGWLFWAESPTVNSKRISVFMV
jgi:hypothetical protein